MEEVFEPGLAGPITAGDSTHSHVWPAGSPPEVPWPALGCCPSQPECFRSYVCILLPLTLQGHKCQ